MWIMVAQMLCKNPPKAGAFLCGNAAGKGCTEASCLGEPGPGREAKVWKPRSPGKALTTVELDPSFCSDSKWSLRISKSNQINILWFIKDHFISLSKFHTCQFQFNGVMKFIQNPSEKNSMTPMTKAAQVLCSLLEGVKRLHCPSPRSKVAKTVFFSTIFNGQKSTMSLEFPKVWELLIATLAQKTRSGDPDVESVIDMNGIWRGKTYISLVLWKHQSIHLYRLHFDCPELSAYHLMRPWMYHPRNHGKSSAFTEVYIEKRFTESNYDLLLHFILKVTAFTMVTQDCSFWWWRSGGVGPTLLTAKLRNVGYWICTWVRHGWTGCTLGFCYGCSW